MFKNMSEKTAHYLTVTVLSVILVVAMAVTIAQNFTIFVFYDKYQKISAAYTAMAMQNADLRHLPPSEIDPDFLRTPTPPRIDSSSRAAKNRNLNNKALEGQIRHEVSEELFVECDVVRRTK